MTTSPLSRREAWALTLVATFTMAVSYIDRQTLAVLAPTVTRALRISDSAYGDLASAFSIAYLVGAPVAGRWIDGVGARRGLLVAVLVWTLVAAMHAAVPGFYSLFALRIALGLAEAPSFPGAAQTVHRALPPEERARGYGVLFTGSSIGAMIAAPLATQLERALSWRAAFVVTAVAGMVWIPLWLALAYRPSARAVLDREARESEPKTPRMSARAVIAHPAVLRAVCVVIASAPAIGFVLTWGSKYLVRAHRLTQAEVGYYLWAPPLLFDVGAVFFGDRAVRRAAARGHDGTPDRLLIALGMALSSTLALMPAMRTPLGATCVMCVSMVGGGALYALATADMMARVPPSAVSAAGGLCAAAQSLALIIANPLIGRAVQRAGTYSGAVLTLGLWVLPGCLAWLLWSAPPHWKPARE